MSKEQQIERRQQFLMSLADFLFATKKTIQLIMHQKIFDKVIDGVEYRFIKFRHFIRLIKRIGMSLSYNDEMCIKTIVPSLLKGCIDITKLEEVLLKIGIEDEKPAPTKHLNYSKLTGPMIRIFNKINHDMNELEFECLEDFIGESNLDTIEIVTKNKSENIQVITPIKLREVLQEKGIINYGQDLDDEFINFVSIGDDETIPIRKLKKALKEISRCKYYQNFGCDFREEYDIDSEIENLLDKPLESSIKRKESNLSTNKENSYKRSNSSVRTSKDKNQSPTDRIKKSIRNRRFSKDTLNKIKNNLKKKAEDILAPDKNADSSFESANLTEEENKMDYLKIAKRKKFGL